MNLIGMGFRFLFGLSIIFALSACDTFSDVRSNIPWNSSVVDNSCIRKAIDSIPFIKFDHQETRDIDSVCIVGDCAKKIYTTFYSVLANKTYRIGYVQFYENRSGKIEVQNYSSTAINHRMPREDEAGFMSSIASLNKQIQKYCPSAGMPSPPR